MEFKGTKGKWYIDSSESKHEDGQPLLYWIYAKGRTQDNIALTIGADGTQLANAKLIAAAPELLKALQKVLKLQQDNYGYGSTTHMKLKSLCDNEVKSAIKKALG